MQDTSSKQKTKQKYKPNHQQTGLHLTQPCSSEEKQTNRNSAQISPYTKLTQTTGPTLGGQKEERIQLGNMEKGDLKHNKFKNIYNEKAEKYYTNEGTN